jgi:hypothetical protein
MPDRPSALGHPGPCNPGPVKNGEQRCTICLALVWQWTEDGQRLNAAEATNLWLNKVAPDVC